VTNKTICPECGDEYDTISLHWAYNGSHRPDLTENQKEIVTGLLMGDGWLDTQSKNARLLVESISSNYLDHLYSNFGILSNRVFKVMSAKESANKNKQNGFSPNAKEENYSDVYRFSTVSHPNLDNFDWYKEEKKVWPSDINLSPTTLKHWYVCDGCFHSSENTQYISISLNNEIGNDRKITSYFNGADIPTPSNYTTFERDCGRKDYSLQFTRSDSEKLFEYMGDPLPDFEYKWPEEYRKN